MTDDIAKGKGEDFTLEDRRARKPYAPPPKRDTDSTLVTSDRTGESGASFTIPPREADTAVTKSYRTSNYSRGTAYGRPPVKKAPPRGEDKVIAEYGKNNGFVRHVTVRSWPSGGGFYDKFARDAQIYHGKTGSSAPHVPFFSYIPQYSHLSDSAMAYYLYMREQLRAGVRLPEADFSYILLYIYEIINIGELIPPANGAELLAKTWLLYRPIHPTLDKYLSEWLPDYCLIYNVPLPRTLAPILCEVGAKSTFKEFFADAALEMGIPLGKMIRLALSDHNAGKSKHAREVAGYTAAVEKVFDTAVDEYARRGTGIFKEQHFKNTSVTRDAFCGSLCAGTVKRKLKIDVHSIFRSPEMRRAVTELMKGAENAVRAAHGIKGRLQAPRLDDIFAPPRAPDAEEAKYLSFYDSPEGDLSAESAAAIEAESWKNAEVLADDLADLDEHDPVEGEMSFDSVTDATENDTAQNISEDMTDTSEAEADSFMSALSKNPALVTALLAAVEGSSFKAACRAENLFADDAAREINELAMEFIGDVVLEGDGMDYVFVEDYADEIK